MTCNERFSLAAQPISPHTMSHLLRLYTMCSHMTVSYDGLLVSVHISQGEYSVCIVQETRMFFSTTFFRVATPYREMSWADFLLADILTSLAKPLSDCERALCHLLSGPVMLPHSTDQVGCASHAMMHMVHTSPKAMYDNYACCRCVVAAHGSSQQG